MDFSFGIVAEGVTDQTVIESILYGFCVNRNLEVDPLQPTEENREKAGWTQVLEYIQTEDFRGAFDFRDFVVYAGALGAFSKRSLPNSSLSVAAKRFGS